MQAIVNSRAPDRAGVEWRLILRPCRINGNNDREVRILGPIFENLISDIVGRSLELRVERLKRSGREYVVNRTPRVCQELREQARSAIVVVVDLTISFQLSQLFELDRSVQAVVVGEIQE